MAKTTRFPTSSPGRIARLGLLGAMAASLTLPVQAQEAALAASKDPQHAQGPQLIVFDAPGATTKVSTLCAGICGTQAIAMNDSGTVVGFYTDDNVLPHGFIRTADGKYTSFEAPDAGTAPYLVQGTLPYTINNVGVIAGQYEDANNVYHGFIRYSATHYEVVDAPGADTKANSGHGTQVLSNNDAGESAGIYVDAAGTEHSFFRSEKGVITPIVPEKDAAFVMVCEETCLNAQGTTVGSYAGTDFVYKGFLRTRDGKIETFTAPGAGTGQGTGTLVASISAAGEITGYLVTDKGFYHGFVRYCDGTFSAFEIPEAANGYGTVPFAINSLGITTGIYVDASSVYHGFERTPSEFVAIFDAPAAAAGKGPGQGTRPSVNNNKGEVAGWTVDPAGLLHGFVWLP